MRHTFDFNKFILFDNVRHLLLLLLPFIDVTLQSLDFCSKLVEAVTVKGSVSERPDEGSVRVFERLEKTEYLRLPSISDILCLPSCLSTALVSGS